MRKPLSEQLRGHTENKQYQNHRLETLVVKLILLVQIFHFF